MNFLFSFASCDGILFQSIRIFVGGMQEVVQSFAENKDFTEVREIQKRILAAYEQDISKHAPNGIVPKIRML